MVLWLSINVALPLMPLALVEMMGRLLEWKRNILDILADGQLYFLAVTACAVFAFDAIRFGKMDAGVFVIVMFSMLTLMVFYTAAILLTHSDAGVATQGSGTTFTPIRKLAVISILLSTLAIGGVSYGRYVLDLL